MGFIVFFFAAPTPRKTRPLRSLRIPGARRSVEDRANPLAGAQSDRAIRHPCLSWLGRTCRAATRDGSRTVAYRVQTCVAGLRMASLWLASSCVAGLRVAAL